MGLRLARTFLFWLGLTLGAPVQATYFCDPQNYSRFAAGAQILNTTNALEVTQLAWARTARYLSHYGIADTPANQPRILSIYDRYLSRELETRAWYPDRTQRDSRGLRMIDAPHLQTLKDKGVPEYVIRHLTVDHHGQFGVGLPPGTNTSTQILDRLTPGSAAFMPKGEFDRAFQTVASDNIGDAFGLAHWIVRHGDDIRGNAELRERLRKLAQDEDFNMFGTELDLTHDDLLAALLRLNDLTIPKVETAFMDRVAASFTLNTEAALANLQHNLDRVLLPKSARDVEYRATLAREFRDGIAVGTSYVKPSVLPLKNSRGGTPPMLFVNTNDLSERASGTFQTWATIPQYARSLETAPGGVPIERIFRIQGPHDASGRDIVFGNLPGRGRSLFERLPGQSQSFAEAFVKAEKAAVQARIREWEQVKETSPRRASEIRVGLTTARERLTQIDQGGWNLGHRPDGTLMFGVTFMSEQELWTFVQSHIALLGY